MKDRFKLNVQIIIVKRSKMAKWGKHDDFKHEKIMEGKEDHVPRRQLEGSFQRKGYRTEERLCGAAKTVQICRSWQNTNMNTHNQWLVRTPSSQSEGRGAGISPCATGNLV